MLRITPRLTDDEYELKLEGCLVGPWVPELEACCRDAAGMLQGRHMRVDLSEVCYVDDAGRQLLMSIYRAGVRLTARGFMMPELVREISEAVEGHRRN